MLLPIIMAGGSGTRLWPVSRTQNPKQFLSFFEQGTLLQQTLARLAHFSAYHPPLIVCHHDHRFLVKEQIENCSGPTPTILLEPEAKNTAATIALAARYAQATYQDATLLVLPADHRIDDAKTWCAEIEAGLKLVEQNHLLTFGIQPRHPEVGYGYIEQGAAHAEHSAYQVQSFKEKPDLMTAMQYLESGRYLWNSGTFAFKAETILDELHRFAPGIHEACTAAFSKRTLTYDSLSIDAEIFSSCPTNSIDYAVMEHTERALVVPLSTDWHDLGSWASIQALSASDANDNVLDSNCYSKETRDCMVRTQGKHTVLLGLTNTVVIDTKDALLIAHKDHLADLKQATQSLAQSAPEVVNQHTQVERPWGHYESVDAGARFQVKRITVKPGHKLSLQKHYHRAEHWIVVSGTAQVTRGTETFLVTVNQSTYIPIGEVHALENPGKVPLELIEVQTGDYLEEDDIIRFEDRYGRTQSPAQSPKRTEKS